MSVLRSDLLSLVSKKFCHISNDAHGGKITLSDSKNTEMKIQLTEIPENAVAFKCENNRGNVFNHTISENDNDYKTHHICDYFMIVNHLSHLELFFFELKKTQGNKSLRDASNQIKCSIPLLRYIVSGLQVHRKYGYQFPENIWKEHYVVLSKQACDKTNPHRKSALEWFPETIHNLPEACACIVNRPLPLSEIRSKSEDAKKHAK